MTTTTEEKEMNETQTLTRNTDDLVQQHMRNYTAAVQKIVRLLPGVVVAELEQEGQECQCSCPSCGFGICLCAISTRRMLGMAWTDAGPIYVPEGILMVRPRSGSAAAQAGFQKGDVVLAVDGKDIESIPMLQETIRNHKSGEEIHFQVQQKSGERVEITVVRP
jgi:S1-C subfamily serine protease